MPKNTFGGKHKHLKKHVNKVEKFELLSVKDDVQYAYISKEYGNRTFDAIILNTYKTVRFQAQYRKRKARVGVGMLVRISLAEDFTNAYYVVEGICGEQETKCVEKSEEYSDKYRKIKQDNDFTYRNGDGNRTFDFEDNDEDSDEEQDVEKKTLSYAEAIMISDSEEEEFDFDDL